MGRDHGYRDIMTVTVEQDGVTRELSLLEWQRETGTPRETIRYRIRAGATPRQAVGLDKFESRNGPLYTGKDGRRGTTGKWAGWTGQPRVRITKRLWQGWTIEQACGLEPPPPRNREMPRHYGRRNRKPRIAVPEPNMSVLIDRDR